MPRIQMTKTAMGPNTRRLKGNAYEVSVEEAKALSADGACIALSEHKKRVVEKKEKVASARRKRNELS